MAVFHYTAMTVGGERVQGVLAAPSEQEVISELQSRELTPLAIAERATPRSWGGVSQKQIGESYGQIADLLHAGVPLLRALKLLAGRKNRPRLAAVFRDLADAVEKGVDLATAMGERPRDFPPVHVAMVRAGEKGGFLEKVLARLCAMVKSQESLKSQIVGSLVYPVILGTFGTLILLTLFIFFVPDFRQTLEKLGGELPAVTRFVFGISDMLTKYGLVTATGLIVVVIGGLFAVRKPAVRAALERLRIKAPILGKLTRAYATSRLCQLLGSMLDNGVPMLTALHIAKDGVGNQVMKQAVEEAAESVKTGQNLAAPLEQSRLFDDDVIEMIRMGEAANNLDEVLLKVSETIETRLSAGLSIATKLIEPAVLVSIGFVVMVVAFALILPLMNATANL